MKAFPLIGTTLAALIIYFMEAFRTKSLKVKTVIGVICAVSWGIGVLLIFFPDAPSPTDWVIPLFKPINKWIGAE